MRRRATIVLAPLLLLAVTAALADGCAKAGTSTAGAGGAGGGASGTGGGTTATTTTTTGGVGGEGGEFNPTSGSGGGTGGGVQMNPCGSECGDTELCDADHTGFDDNCDGQVDEGCPCSAGQAHFCFKGDPSFYNAPGCFPGTEKCSENGLWGPCQGGVHADPIDQCFVNDQIGCHAISAVPFQDVNLKTGTGTFGMDAEPGTEKWLVTCPPGVNPCPAVSGANPEDDFKPLQSGEYTVKYTKGLPGGGTASCTYPLIVGAPGLRVELSWEHTAKDTGVDLDLHVHKPNDTSPWGFVPGTPEDCSWSNCTIDQFWPVPVAEAPEWFAPPPAKPPTPVSWWLDPVFAKNTCYFAPQGVGTQWQIANKGCHNPRLDLDNYACQYNIKDPNDPDFCAPENLNIDYPPVDQWMRIGVHYFSNNKLAYDVHPSVKVFCNGTLAAELGTAGYDAPITFTAKDGAGAGINNRFWVVADVIFEKDQCQAGCTVKPVFADENAKTPHYMLDTQAAQSIGPAYPAMP